MNVDLVRQEIANLLTRVPELIEDDILRTDCIEGETSAFEFLREVERKRREAATMAGALATEIAQLGERQARFERREKAMRDLAFKIMQAGDLPKIELPEASYGVTRGRPKVIITDEAVLPDRYWRIKREPNITEIAATLKDRPVEGAILSNAEPHLTIRTR